jgi:hypothetical protein
VKCYVDDDLDSDLLLRLARGQGHELVSPRAVGYRGARDSTHLAYAVRQGLPLLSGNTGDLSLFTTWPQHLAAGTLAFFWSMASGTRDVK